MTPEARAQRAALGGAHCCECADDHWTPAMVTAIREAVAAEREACAILAETHYDDWKGRVQMGRALAAAIRARGAE